MQPLRTIAFSATDNVSLYNENYRQLQKSGDGVEYDLCDGDDAIALDVTKLTDMIIIDCNKKTGEFRLMFRTKDVIHNAL